MNVIAKKLKAKEKIRQKMSRSGLVEENLSTGEEKRLSKKEKELDFSKQTAEKNPELKSQGKRNPRFNFSEEDLANPKLEKQIGRVQKAEEKLDKAYEKIPKKKKLVMERGFDEAKGKKKTKIHFEEMEKKPPHRQKFHQPVERMTSSAENVLHGKIYEVEKENVGVESGHLGERTGEVAIRHSARKINSAYRHHRLKPFINAEKAERALEKETVKFRYQKAMAENPKLASSPLSRFMQKRKIQREYAKEVRAAGRAGSTIGQNVRKTIKESGKKVAAFVRKGGKWLVVLLPVFLVIVLFGGGITSCSSMLTGGLNSVIATSYTAEEADINGAEADYLAKEIELRNKLNSIETDYPGYDEYHYNLAEIGHDPYELTSYLTVMFEDYTRAEVQSELQRLFNRQYSISYDVQRERRTRTEIQTQINYEWEWDEEIGDWILIETEEEVEVEIEYDYWILTTTLTNNSLGGILTGSLTADQKERYDVLLETRGNREGLFPDSPALAGGINIGEYTDYDIPPEALTDARFRRMITEAEKYLGYPYVWGGSSPSTSFDCSGFVSWVINHCGNGWNVGRLGAEGLKQICAIIPPSEAKPGDLIFFQGTYNTTGASHVAIYCGNNMMIHCGNPIQYANISNQYWQEHFYCFGRLN